MARAIEITLSDEQAAKLGALAANAGTTPDELLRAHLADWLGGGGAEGDFVGAAAYVLRKNAELYRRLATPPGGEREDGDR